MTMMMMMMMMMMMQDKNGTIELNEFLVMMAKRMRDSNTIRNQDTLLSLLL